jgi:hypothetical protein
VNVVMNLREPEPYEGGMQFHFHFYSEVQILDLIKSIIEICISFKI